VRGLEAEEQRNLFDFFTKSAGEILDRYFTTDIVQALFGFDAVVGNYASPYSPGSAYVLLHHLFGEAAGVPGAWGHAIGGMGAITQAMAKAAQAKGVEIVLNAPVSELIVENGRAVGAVAGGRAYRAKAVAANVNPHHLFTSLIPQGAVLYFAAAAGRSPHRRNHHRAVIELHGPRLRQRARRWLGARADRRDADPLHPRRHAGATRCACRQPVLPAFPL
jgi:phytoene dehydrogenase-like protein